MVPRAAQCLGRPVVPPLRLGQAVTVPEQPRADDIGHSAEPAKRVGAAGPMASGARSPSPCFQPMASGARSPSMGGPALMGGPMIKPKSKAASRPVDSKAVEARLADAKLADAKLYGLDRRVGPPSRAASPADTKSAGGPPSRAASPADTKLGERGSSPLASGRIITKSPSKPGLMPRKAASPSRNIAQAEFFAEAAAEQQRGQAQAMKETKKRAGVVPDQFLVGDPWAGAEDIPCDEIVEWFMDYMECRSDVVNPELNRQLKKIIEDEGGASAHEDGSRLVPSLSKAIFAFSSNPKSRLPTSCSSNLSSKLREVERVSICKYREEERVSIESTDVGRSFRRGNGDSSVGSTCCPDYGPGGLMTPSSQASSLVGRGVPSSMPSTSSSISTTYDAMQGQRISSAASLSDSTAAGSPLTPSCRPSAHPEDKELAALPEQRIHAATRAKEAADARLQKADQDIAKLQVKRQELVSAQAAAAGPGCAKFQAASAARAASPGGPQPPQFGQAASAARAASPGGPQPPHRLDSWKQQLSQVYVGDPSQGPLGSADAIITGRPMERVPGRMSRQASPSSLTTPMSDPGVMRFTTTGYSPSQMTKTAKASDWELEFMMRGAIASAAVVGKGRGASPTAKR